MIQLNGYWYDGESSRREAVTLSIVDDMVYITGGPLNKQYQMVSSQLMPRIASAPARIQFSDGSVAELPVQEGIDQLYARWRSGGVFTLVHFLENHVYSIIIITLVSLVFIFGLVSFGVPVLAKYAADRMPVEFERQTGEQTLKLIDEALCEPSKLSMTRQRSLMRKLSILVPASLKDHARIEFRHCPKIGPNAFALPSGIILFTDQMVEIAESDDEITGVFAHELGHVVHRHMLRQVLQSSVVGLLVVVITGDIGTASSLAVALPVIMLETSFSRKFERDADVYAAELMRRHNLDPSHLATILTRIDEGHNDTLGLESFISTHPLTDERVNFLTGPAGEK